MPECGGCPDTAIKRRGKSFYKSRRSKQNDLSFPGQMEVAMRKDINFFSVYSSPLDSHNGFDPVLTTGLSIIAVSLVVVLGLFGFFKGKALLSKFETAKIQNYLQSPSVQSATEKADKYSSRISLLDSYKNAVSKAYGNFKSNPSVNSSLLSSIEAVQPADVSTLEINFSNGAVTLSCTSKSEQSIYQFVHKLKTNSNFDEVGYSGFTKTGAVYNFKVDCTLKEASRP